MAAKRPEPLQIGIPPSDGLFKLAQSAKNLLERLLRIDGEPAELTRARELVEQASALLADHAAPGNQPRFSPGDGSPDTRPYYFPALHERPVHVSMPWMRIDTRGTTWRGRVRFDLIHEGPPGAVHGGFVAYFFDNMLGQLVVANELYGPTRELKVQYRKPTPVLRELDFELTLDTRDGRLIPARARLQDGATCTAEAEAIFITPPVESDPPNASGTD